MSFSEAGVFIRPEALAADFLPEQLPGREAHLKELAFLVEPALSGQKPNNAFLFGPPGTGKTASAKYVLRQLAESTSRVLPVYVNAWQEGTRLAVLARLALALKLPLPRRGLAEDEVLSRVMEVLRKDQRVLLVVVDEMDRLDGRDRLLYDLSRAGEVNQVLCGVLGISNDPELLGKLDARVRSSLLAKGLEYKSYSPVQLKAILAERVKLAFRPNTVSPEALGVAAALAAKNKGDARLALELLLRAGRLAESKGRVQVNVSEVKAASEPFKIQPPIVLPQELSTGEQTLLNTLKVMPGARKNGVEVSMAFEEYQKQRPETVRSLRNHLSHLEQRGVVETWNEQGVRLVKVKRAS